MSSGDVVEGEAVQIVRVNDQDPEHSYILDEEALRYLPTNAEKFLFNAIWKKDLKTRFIIFILNNFVKHIYHSIITFLRYSQEENLMLS